MVYVGSMADRREWATYSRFQSLCVSLFDQASPGPQEHSFNTSSKRTKQPLSALSLPHPALTLTRRDKQWQSLSRSALLGDSEADAGRSIKGIGNTLAVDKPQHNSMWPWLPQRWEKTGYTASGDKEGEGSGIMGHLQLKSLLKQPCKATTACLLCVTVTGTCKQCYYYQVSCMGLWRDTPSRCDQHKRISTKE